MMKRILAVTVITLTTTTAMAGIRQYDPSSGTSSPSLQIKQMPKQGIYTNQKQPYHQNMSTQPKKGDVVPVKVEHVDLSDKFLSDLDKLPPKGRLYVIQEPYVSVGVDEMEFLDIIHHTPGLEALSLVREEKDGDLEAFKRRMAVEDAAGTIKGPNDLTEQQINLLESHIKRLEQLKGYSSFIDVGNQVAQHFGIKNYPVMIHVRQDGQVRTYDFPSDIKTLEKSLLNASSSKYSSPSRF